MHAYMYVYKRAFVHKLIHRCVYTYIHIHIYTHTHIRTYIQDCTAIYQSMKSISTRVHACLFFFTVCFLASLVFSMQISHRQPTGPHAATLRGDTSPSIPGHSIPPHLAVTGYPCRDVALRILRRY